jgi:hypothetical protein
MHKTIAASYSSTGIFYFLISILGYAALGTNVPGDVLVGFSVNKEVMSCYNYRISFIYAPADLTLPWSINPSYHA